MHTELPPIQPQCYARSTGIGNAAVTGLVQTLLAAFCEIATSQSWPHDSGENYIKRGRETFDFIVVGAGTAGSVVAARLSENPNYRVLLIEAGDDPPIESLIPGLQIAAYGSLADWNYLTLPNGKSCLGSPGGACRWISGRLLGGASAVNALFAIRGNRQDFDSWEALGNPSWGWDDVLPYMMKTEDHRSPVSHKDRGIHGPLIINRTVALPGIHNLLLEAGKQAGYDVVDDFREGHYLGYGPIDMIVANGIRNTPASVLLTKYRPNLQVIKNAVASKVNFDKSKRARSVTFIYTDKSKKTHELVADISKEVIISAGTVESPKLLMLSGIGPADHLRPHGIKILKDLPVGSNLQDHIYIGLYFKCNANPTPDINDITFNYFIHRNETFSSARIVNVASFLDVRKESGLYPTIQIQYVWYPKNTPFIEISGLTPAVSGALAKTLQKNGVLIMNMALLKPKSRGSVNIKSRDFTEKPIIDPNYLSHYDDVHVFKEAIRTVLRLESTPIFKRKQVTHIPIPIPECEHAKMGSDEYWECYIRYNTVSIAHSVGTVKMGPHSDPTAVVDSRLRVIGVDRLRVADASIMPTVTSANTMLSTIMIGEKAADFIKNEWKSKV